MKRITIAAVAGLLVAGTHVTSFAKSHRDKGSPALRPPKLAEIMLMLQIRHAKLSLAGEAQNWPLAKFQIEELKEAFEDAEKYHPMFKDIPIKGMIDGIANPAVAAVEKAVDSKDRTSFVRAFEGLTAACNNCHRAANFNYIVIQRPATSPYPNQSFQPVRN
jgi:hypothetical protein